MGIRVYARHREPEGHPEPPDYCGQGTYDCRQTWGVVS